MEFGWSTAQQSRQVAALEFAATLVNSDSVARDSAGEFDSDAWQKCARFGIQSMAAPAQYHAFTDTDLMTAMLVMETLGTGCRDNGLTFALNAHMWTVMHPIAVMGSDEQKNRFLPGLCDGTLIGAHAMTESDSGSDAFSLTTLARKTEGGYILNGKKQYISLGPIADLALVFATTDPALGKWGVTAFLVEASREGFAAGPVRDKMGLRTVPMSDITLNECFVPTTNRIGPEGAGVGLSTSFLEYERCCILASQLGAMARQLADCIAYARHRKQYGKPIGKYQSVANRIVDMKVRLETSRLLLYQSAWLKQSGRPALLDTSLVKLHLSESFAQSSLDAVRIHGGRGYLTEFGVERDLRDAVGGTIYAGTSDIQRNIIAGLLGL